ncbi:glycosyltransferase family 2 protein [Pigmentibacter ruber]
MAIPIFILSYENLDFLTKTILSIQKNTLMPYQIIVCDNGSKNIELINSLDRWEKEGIKIYKNKGNFWILGLNRAIVQELPKFKTEYLVVTDDDIEVPPPKDNVCWLTHLYNLMNDNKFLGKLGLGLSLENIKNDSNLSYIYQREMLYKKNYLAPGIFASHVDTTIAIYRNDLFIYGNMKFYPGHGSYIKPYYHVGRTTDFECIHLGWELYKNPKELSKTYINKKVLCFTVCAAYLDRKILNSSAWVYFYFYILFGKIFKTIWGFLLIYRWILFILKNKIIRMNGIYENSK